MNESLSSPEILKRSKSTTLHPRLELETKTPKQIGDYRLGSEIGSGAFGKVVLGKHTLTGESVAVKILDKIILSQTPEDYELVKQEISILKIVKHKYIVRLYQIMQTAQHIYIIMEYCEGKDLMDYILSKQRLSELETLKYFHQLINALFYLHSQNIAHRDVKIDNMLLDKNMDLKLVDFGLSTKYSDENLLDQPCGTVVYAAPEVLEGNEYHGMLADVWSSGIVLYGMASGYLPFSDKDDEVNKKDVLEGKIDIPEFFSPLLKDLLKHMLDINPITRYTLQEIKQHPWFNLTKANLIPGIIIGYNTIPVDENILNLCVAYNADKEKVEQSVKNNRYDSGSALYYLLVRKIIRKGFQSISDLSSDAFIEFILDDDNLINRRSIRKNIYNKNTHRQKQNELLLVDDNFNTNNNFYNNPINNEYYLPSSKNNENLSAAPRLLPLDNNTNNNTNKINKEKRKEKKEVLIKQKRRNKINSAVKNNKGHKYTTKNSGELSTKKPFIYNKYEMKIKNNINNNNIIKEKKRLNNSANLRTNHIKKEKLIIEQYNNNTLSVIKDESDMIKSNQMRNVDKGFIFNENHSLEFKSGTEKINLEIKNNKIKNKKVELNKENKDKSTIKNDKININNKYLKQSTLEIYKKNSNKKNNKNKKKDINNNKNNKDLIKEQKEKENKKNPKKEKSEVYSGNSCINIKTNNYLKTPNKINNNNFQIKNSIQSSTKNIYYKKRNFHNHILNLNDKKGINLNTSNSDKFTNLQNYTKNKPSKKISKSIQTRYNSKYNENKKKEESKILFSSSKKRDYSLYQKKNKISSILGLNSNKIKTLDNTIVHELYDSSKLFLSDKKKKSALNSLNLSLNKSTSNNYNTIKYPKKKQTEYIMENTIYELHNKKNKNKNRIRLDYNPNKIYELTSGDDNKKKNQLNKSVTIGKTDEKKMTGLTLYMNNYYNKHKMKRTNLESSAFTNRKIYGYSIRDLSFSPNQKYLNEKTRKDRIPWKYQKKGIDSKLTTETIYNKYINRLNKNPLKPNGNKKLKIQTKKKNLLYENNTLINNNNILFHSIKNENKILNQSITENKEKRRLSQEKRERRVNNHRRDKTNYEINIQEKNKNKLSAKKLNVSTSTKNKMKYTEQIFYKEKASNNNFNIFDLSCLVIKEKNMKDCNQVLINKLKKNGFYVISSKLNEIKCTKNRINCQIDIDKIKWDNFNERNVFCYKINNKKIEKQINKIIAKIISS